MRDSVDVTMPGRPQEIGGLHPVTRTLDRLNDSLRVWATVVTGPK